MTVRNGRAGAVAVLSLLVLIANAFFEWQKTETRRTVMYKEIWLAFCWVFMTVAALSLTIVGASQSAQVTSSVLPQGGFSFGIIELVRNGYT